MRSYRLHDLRIGATSDHPAVREMLHRTLRYKTAQPAPEETSVDVTLDFRTDRPAPSIPDDARSLGTSAYGLVETWTAPGRLILSRDNATVEVDLRDGVARAAVDPRLLEARDGAQRDPLFYLVTISLLALLRYQGWHGLHTAALAREGRGVLLVARSDSGKSTAALNLVRSGWSYLSDDTVLLRRSDAHVQAYSFRHDFCLDPGAAEHFPELRGHDWPPSLSDTSKWQVDLEQVYPGQFALQCTPRAVVLPKIDAAAESHLEPVAPKVVLAQLVNQGAFFLTPDAEVADRHLRVLRQLMAQSRAYRLCAGRDVLDAPEQMDALLRPLVEEPTERAANEPPSVS